MKKELEVVASVRRRVDDFFPGPKGKGGVIRGYSLEAGGRHRVGRLDAGVLEAAHEGEDVGAHFVGKQEDFTASASVVDGEHVYLFPRVSEQLISIRQGQEVGLRPVMCRPWGRTSRYRGG